MSQKTQAVIICHDNNVIFSGEITAVLVPRASRANDEPATMVIEHDRTATLVHSGRPYIKDETVLRGKGFLLSKRRTRRLKRRWAGRECIPNASPRLKRWRGLEPILSRDGPGVRYSLECDHIPC